MSLSEYYYDDIDSLRKSNRLKYFKRLRRQVLLNRQTKEDPIIVYNIDYYKKMYPKWYPWHDLRYKNASFSRLPRVEVVLSNYLSSKYEDKLTSIKSKEQTTRYSISDIASATEISTPQVTTFFRKNVFLTDATSFCEWEFELYRDALLYATTYKEVFNLRVGKNILDFATLYVRSHRLNYKQSALNF